MPPRFDAYVRTKGGYRFWNSATGDEIEVADTAAAANEAMRINSAAIPSSTPADATGAGGAPGAVAPLPAGAGGAPQAAPVMVQTAAGPAPDAPADQGAQGAPAVTPPPAPAPVAPAAPPPLAPMAAQMGAAGAPAPRPVGAPPRPTSGPAGGPPPKPREPPMVLKGRSITREGMMLPGTIDAQSAAAEAEAGAKVEGVEAKASRGQLEADIVGKASEIEKGYGLQNAETRRGGLLAYDNMLRARARLLQDVEESKIDSGRFWKNAEAAGQAAAGLGIIAGSIGAAMTGSGARNLALETIERAIDRDVQEQVADIDKKRYQATELTKFGEDVRRFWGEDKIAVSNELRAAHLGEQARAAEALAKITTDKEKSAQYAAIGAELKRKQADLLASNDGKVKVAEQYGPPAPVGGGAPKKKPKPYVVVGGQVIPLKPGMSDGDVGKITIATMAAERAKQSFAAAQKVYDEAILGNASPSAATKAAEAYIYDGAVWLAQTQMQGQATKDNIAAVHDPVKGLDGKAGIEALQHTLDGTLQSIVRHYGERDQDAVDAAEESHVARQRGGR